MRDEHGLLSRQDAWDFPEHSATNRRIRRARMASRRRRFRGGAHGVYLAMLSNGTKVHKVLELVNGRSVMGMAWTAAITHFVTHVRFWPTIEIATTRQRRLDSPAARRGVRIILNLLALLERNGPEKLSVLGQNAFWGKSYEPGGYTREELDLKWAERDALREIHGQVRLSRLNRKPLRKLNAAGRHQQGGLAARVDLEVRQLQRWLDALKLARLFRSRQPRSDADDAILPRNGSWAYPEITVLREPAEAVIERLQEMWGELERAGVPLPRGQGEPRRTKHGHVESARGPPESWLAVEPDEHLHRDIGLSLTELDEIEQLCGIPS